MRYIIIDPKEGVFLGTKEDPSRREIGMLFSNNNLFDLTKAASWAEEKSAKDYMVYYVKKYCPEASVVAIDADSDHVDVVDIIKAGYGDYCSGMIEALPMPTTQLQ